MISLLAPTRKRPDGVVRMQESALATALHPEQIEFVHYVDDDDDSYYDLDLKQTVWVEGPRIVLSEMWNKCHEQATGPYFMHCSDDIVFRTDGWDLIVTEAFPDDKIAFVHGDDGHWGRTFGTHGFIHQRWVETVGYFVPPYFSCDYNDTWLNDVANRISRRFFVPILTEHLHPAFGKGPMDETHRDRLIRGAEDNVDAMYQAMYRERGADADKLWAVIQAERVIG